MSFNNDSLRGQLHYAKAHDVSADGDRWRAFHALLVEDVRLVVDAIEWVFRTAQASDREAWDMTLGISLGVWGHYDEQREQMRPLPAHYRFGVRNGAKLIRVDGMDAVEWLRRIVQSREAWVDRYGLGAAREG